MPFQIEVARVLGGGIDNHEVLQKEALALRHRFDIEHARQSHGWRGLGAFHLTLLDDPKQFAVSMEPTDATYPSNGLGITHHVRSFSSLPVSFDLEYIMSVAIVAIHCVLLV